MYRRFGRQVRHWSSRIKSPSNVSSRSSRPGTVRITKTYGAEKHEAEVDSTLARIIGSDWGDRSRQPVSLPMRIYWIVFTVVLGNGLYTYCTGKDESFFVEKIKKKADEKMKIQENENEFMTLADEKEDSEGKGTIVKSSEQKRTMLPSSVPGLPFMVPNMSLQMNGRHTKSKKDLEQQFEQLCVQQERLQKQICAGEEGVAKDELEHQVRMIDIQKEQIKLQLKRL
ncbi:unnamed protein product [Peronospora farinosa]|uniref:Uncharacterized protein n=1 Tax=Peronospora farinosa TaxID=134698 RepID=A0AAV0UPV7_9STRA|nr:unnamed protein product [Peronospora farinosa]CAI5737316.1 unnamed protein product [Peronospora farinosa]